MPNAHLLQFIVGTGVYPFCTILLLTFGAVSMILVPMSINLTRTNILSKHLTLRSCRLAFSLQFAHPRQPLRNFHQTFFSMSFILNCNSRLCSTIVASHQIKKDSRRRGEEEYLKSYQRSTMHANKGCLQMFAPDSDASMFRCKESILSVIDRELWEAFKPFATASEQLPIPGPTMAHVTLDDT